MIIWGTSPCRMLQIHSLHQVATGTPCHVPLQRREIFVTIVDGFGTNFMVPSDWDWAPKCVCGPNFMSNLIGESPIFRLLETSRAQIPPWRTMCQIGTMSASFFSFFSAKSFWVVRPRKAHFSQELYTWHGAYLGRTRYLISQASYCFNVRFWPGYVWSASFSFFFLLKCTVRGPRMVEIHTGKSHI